MLKVLKEVHEALDKRSRVTVVAFHTEFLKAFDRVPQFELQKEVSAIGVGGCSLVIL